MTRDQIAQQLMLQQQQQQQRGSPLGSPFAPAPVPPRQQPLVAGNPTPPIAAPIPQYGFETGYKAATAGASGKESNEQSKLKMLMQFMAGGG